MYLWPMFQMFHDVSVLFSDVVGFTNICSLISPMDVVTMLNSMYTVFDQISEQHNVYKVSQECFRGKPVIQKVAYVHVAYYCAFYVQWNLKVIPQK